MILRRLIAVTVTLACTAVAHADYLFTYFTDNGQDGLHLASSTDGYTWEKLNNGHSYLAPTVGLSKLMRDPCVARGPDGTYHMVWTAGWNENDIGYASTRDFVHWSAEKSIPVMASEPGVRNTWAPEIDWDEAHGDFLIFWASTVPGKFPATANASEHGYNHRIYCTTTRDFATFTPTRLFYDPGFSVIDATFLNADGRHTLIVKDETVNPPKKYLQTAPAETLEGPFGKLSPPITPPGLWCEGPTALKIGDEYVVYFDAYQTKHYGAIRSRDLVHWEDVSSQMHFPDEGTPQRIRHGTVIEVPHALVEKLKTANPPASARSSVSDAGQRLPSETSHHSGPDPAGVQQPRPASSQPVVIKNAPPIDFTKPDGGLLPVAGADNYEVFRSSHARPDLAEGKGYTYNHHPDMAVWHGRFYVAWDSGAKDEDTWPAHELYSTSTNGRDWSAPAELFPEGVSTPTRLYFFHAPNGRMLAFAGLRIGHVKTEEEQKGPMVVREITTNHTLGPVFTLRPASAGERPDAPAVYTRASDAGFVEACRQLLAAHVTLETQDMGVFLDPTARMKWHSATAWPDGKIGRGFWKAPSFYHRRDGAIVGIGKNGWTTISADEGGTWSQPVVPPTLHTNNAKVWGQRTGDGRYALVYNPSPRPRYPLAIVTSDDGIVFHDMRAVQSRWTTQRYPGINKNPGLQYIRGISEWSTDGSVSAATQALWIAYSDNKEDIWVSRVPLPVGHPATPDWNVYQPKWATVTTDGLAGVTLATQEPYDCAEAVQFFTPAAQVAATMTVTTPPAGFGAVDIELQAADSDARPVRLRLAGDGFFRGYDRDKMVEFGRYAPGTKLEVKIDAACDGHGVYTISINGRKIDDAQFAVPVPSLGRIAVRAWARTDADRPTDFLPATALVAPDFDQPAAAVTTQITGLSVNGRP